VGWSVETKVHYAERLGCQKDPELSDDDRVADP